MTAPTALDLIVDLNTMDDTGLPWAFLDRAVHPERLVPGAYVIVGAGSVGTRAMREMFIDYNHIGHGCRFRIGLFRSEREGLGVGDIVLVVGDSVEPRQARVIALAPRRAARLSWNS